LRYCVGAKVKHLLRTLPPGTAAGEFHRLHTISPLKPTSYPHPILMLGEWRLYHWVWEGTDSPLSATPHHPHPPPTSPPPTLTRRTSLLLITMGLFMPHGRPLGAS
jgi:hypothetical protein